MILTLYGSEIMEVFVHRHVSSYVYSRTIVVRLYTERSHVHTVHACVMGFWCAGRNV